MRKDIRLRLFLIYTYDEEFKTTLARLQKYFFCDRSEVENVTKRLAGLGLVEIIGEEVKRIYRHTTLPAIPEAFDLRRRVLFKTLDLNIKPGSYITNVHLKLTEDSIKKIMELIYFTRANCIRLEKEDRPGKKIHFQIAIVTNRIDESDND